MSLPQHAFQVPVTMPQPAGRARESSRSSRRKAGSTGPKVMLGGGAGTLGQIDTGVRKEVSCTKPFGDLVCRGERHERKADCGVVQQPDNVHLLPCGSPAEPCIASGTC